MGLIAKIVYDWNFIALRYLQKKYLFSKQYKFVKGIRSKHPGLLVSMHDGRFHTGGLGDRLHGIISLFIYCQDRNWDYKVNFCVPFRLKDYLEPNEYDWDIDPAELSDNIFAVVPIVMGCTFKKYHGTSEQEAAFMCRFLDWNIRKKTNKEYHIYTNMHLANKADVYSKCFKKLFKPTQILQDAINLNKNKIGSDYVSVTLRFQNLLGDFSEGKFPTLKVHEQLDLMEKVKLKIEEIHNVYHPNQKILVTSDSRKFLDEIDSIDYIYTIPGKLVHLSYTLVNDFEIHLKSFVDLLMLAEAQKIYLLVTGDMYHSGFAESASFINNRPYCEIVF